MDVNGTIDRLLRIIENDPENDENKRTLQCFLKTLEKLDENTKEVELAHIQKESELTQTYRNRWKQ
jgi:hypothetical protein